MERRRNLDVFFKPQSVAVIGATEAPGTGRMLLRNLISTPFGGPVFPVNPRRAHVLGVKAYKSVLDVPEPIDLTVIVTPAQTVPGIIDQCAQVGVKGAIVISAGFRDRRTGRGTRTTDYGEGARDACGGSQLPGHHESAVRAERDLRERHGTSGQCRIYQPEWSALCGNPRLESA